MGEGAKGSPARPLSACGCHPTAAVETWLPARGAALVLPSASENLSLPSLAHCSLVLSLSLSHTHTILLYSEYL